MRALENNAQGWMRRKSLELSEVVEVSDVQGGERYVVRETTGCDPGVVDRSRSASLVGVGHDLAPLAGDISTAGQKRPGDPAVDLRLAPGAEAALDGPALEFASAHEGRDQLVANQLRVKALWQALLDQS